MLTSLFLTAAFLQVPAEAVERGLPQGVVIGEISSDSVLIHARLTAAKLEGERGVAGRFGSLSFSFVETQEPSSGDRLPMKVTSVLVAQAQNDFIVRERVEGLRPNTEYRWLAHGLKQGVVFGEFEAVDLGRGTFRTLPGNSASRPLNFVVLNCMNQHYFLNGGQGRPAYQGEDKALGFPGLEAIDELDPAFVIFAGDSVYYDRPAKSPATDAESMRAHWHRLFAQPRMRKLLASTTTYWLKDDHDHRFNDSDQTGEKLPGHELGRKIFREQVPIVALDDDESPTWRTVRVSKDLQIWMTEGRDHRSPNSMPDGPEKTMWGIEQRDWLKRTLLESDAFFKVLVSPTPLVGPDDGYKSDNHTNPKGFLTEGEAFHAWLTEHKLNDAGFVVICGDRHWQYHSVHPQGTHEFAVGALIDANARLGRKPGDPKSTDPEALVKQLYSSKKPSGGFLEVRIATEPTLRMELIFRDERGIELYRAQRNP
jgi:alkaline phosphatase/alkaline phosphatase D